MIATYPWEPHCAAQLEVEKANSRAVPSGILTASEEHITSHAQRF